MALTSLPSCRTDTLQFRRRAVERVILDMHDRLDQGCLDEGSSLESMAEVAIMSPYHFNRVFRQITGIPPCQFFWAFRLQAAKRMLLNTGLNVVDICFAVGYNSLGTFTTRFTQLVGVPPLRFRRLADEFAENYPDWLFSLTSGEDAATPGMGISGQIEAPESFSGLILVGLFSSPVPQGEPVACALLDRAGSFRIESIPDGSYYLFAAGLRSSNDPLDCLLAAAVLRARTEYPVWISGGRIKSGPITLKLRPGELTDPPILVSLAKLLTQRADALPVR